MQRMAKFMEKCRGVIPRNQDGLTWSGFHKV